MISVRSLDQVICGYCGIIGELYMGDGNQKNCCSLKGVKYSDSDTEGQADLPSLEDFLSALKSMWIAKATFSNWSGVENLDLSVSKIPPIIAPALRGDKVYNTESKKKSVYLKGRTNIEGDSALLHQIITNENLNMSSLESLTVEELKRIAGFCKIPILSSYSKSLVIAKITALYEYLLVGNSPCHGFTKVPGHTGGFYHFVCRHGCTVGSKFLLLQESVRDAADIYMSLRFPPPLFICDTPCGFARHMDVQHPTLARKLWNDRVGCFEKPTLDKTPGHVSNPALVPLEYRSENMVLPSPDTLQELVHPITGSAQRFVAQDRFHATAEPHKSPLCKFHDINNWEQANTIKTSQQESENHRKNFLRLRSSTMQTFPVHFTYNFLMDFYHNEQIVQKQRQEILSRSKEKGANGSQIYRDVYKRFMLV
ncbi:HMG domain-containing protein 3 [Exaiptasia diaphana]|uniref:Uncharacterized protein n=1 Tax=Exaiptasia diaphana TaxID=2652724 RepID=A0A913XK11_EXADI|nr:HMG domain-containing protein 3 [Exaiptasia diaphana]